MTKIFVEVRKPLSDKEFLKVLESRPEENFFELEAYSAMIISHLSLRVGK